MRGHAPNQFRALHGESHYYDNDQDLFPQDNGDPGVMSDLQSQRSSRDSKTPFEILGMPLRNRIETGRQV
ncbi:hypothetical protein F66182_5366 [Fusarium sp. NRRL 66182]|nr:hypothetical protein F66182_5366 [Fusarium sp. NRRL 66182]